jgi:hypothetical protein
MLMLQSLSSDLHDRVVFPTSATYYLLAVLFFVLQVINLALEHRTVVLL